MREISIDCAQIQSWETLHAVFAQTLSFPEYYGKNLDALYDCLTELPCPTHLTLLHFDHLADALGDYALPLQQVLQEAEQDLDHFILTFA